MVATAAPVAQGMLRLAARPGADTSSPTAFTASYHVRLVRMVRLTVTSGVRLLAIAASTLRTDANTSCPAVTF